MSDEQQAQYEEEMRRGEQARQVIQNPAYQDAFLRMKADLLSGFEQSSSRQDEERKEIWRRIQTLNKLQAELEEVMSTGNMARQSLLQKAKSFINR